jgi:hypothetical protein
MSNCAYAGTRTDSFFTGRSVVVLFTTNPLSHKAESFDSPLDDWLNINNAF